MDPIQSKRFVQYFLLITVGSIACLSLFNVFIDPFGIFQMPVKSSLNEYKFSLTDQHRLHRAFELARKKPTAIFLGSSRTMAGLNPDDLSKYSHEYVYNAAFSGACFGEMAAYFEHALHYQPDLKLVVLGLDLFSFGTTDHAPDFSENILKEGTFSLTTWLSFIFSQTGIKASWNTLKRNFLGEKQHIFQPNGLMPSSAIEKDLLYNGKNQFANKDSAFLQEMLGVFYKNFSLDEKKIEQFKQLVQRCQEKNIELKVFICPSKVAYWETLYQNHYWEVLEDFKKKLAAIYPVWDFSGYNGITTQSDETSDHYFYYDCSHFTPYVGHYILDCLFGLENHLSSAGQLLTKETIEQALQEIKQQRIKWLESKPEILKYIPNEHVD